MSNKLNFFFNVSISLLLVFSKNINCMDSNSPMDWETQTFIDEIKLSNLNINNASQLELLKQEASQKLQISKAILNNNINFFKDPNNSFIKNYINSYFNLTFIHNNKIEFIGYPLLKAAQSNNTPMVIAMINLCDAYVNIQNELDGYTALHWAVENDNLTLVLFLIHLEANINATNNNWEQPKYIAIRKKNIEMQILLEAAQALKNNK